MQQESAKEISKKSRSSFYYAFNLLPPAKREAMNIIYAYCRKTDDIVDNESKSVENRKEDLDHWRMELDKALAGRSVLKLLNDTVRVIKEYNIPTEPFYEIIKGVETDLSKTRFETFVKLKTYSYRVASTVGLMCIEVFGYKNRSTVEFAEYLGIALQLTNIIRDVNSDARMGRIYLPLEDLRRFDYSESDLFNKVHNQNFLRLMNFEADRAKHYFKLASNALAKEDKLSMFAARAMQHIYTRNLDRIIKSDFDVYRRTIKVGKLEKIGIALGVWAKYNLMYKWTG